MRSGAVIFGVVVSALLLTAAGALHLLADNSSGQHYRKSIDLLRQMQLLSSDWSMEITRVKADPFADFDSLAAFIPRMARFKESLSETVQRIPDLPDRLASDIQAYLNAIEAKEERIERFKTGYAVVRNSSRYLPLAATNVLQQAQNTGEEALVRSVSSLVRDVNLYLATPTDTFQSRLMAEIEKLRETSVAYPPPLTNALANLFSHAEVLVAKQGPTEELLRSATSNDISDLTDQLSGNLEFELGKKEILAAYYDRGLLAVIAALIVFWILLALQQRLRDGSAMARAAPRPAAIEVEPAPDQGPPVFADAPHPAAETAALPVEPESPPDEPPLVLKDSAPPLVPAAVPSEHRDAESELLHGFVVNSLAGILTASADEIGSRMEYLRRTQKKIQDAFADADAIAESSGGAGVEEEIETISAIASNVRQRMNGIADLAKRLDAFSNAPVDTADHSMIDLNACVDDAIEAAGAGNGATIVKSFGNVPQIFASKTEFKVMLAEIIENSILAVRDLEDRKGIIKIDTAQTNDEVLITVIDNGGGITPERRMNIFKPFYTSRDSAMGIGLALAGHLVKKYDGVIKINSLPGQGTVARITLPAGISGP
ncbi:MAG: ATP-binding protein [Rhodospirillales bacterium]|nr:ATP-binding protein [Rhodospirillales bacterium]